jgi:hypothetical protein
MSRQRFLLLLIAAIAVIAGGLYAATQRNRQPATEGAALLPSFATEVNAVTAVTVRKGGAEPAVTLHKTGTDWTVAQRADYPADVSKIRNLLLALRDAKIVEEKTANPAQFAAIGVADPAAAEVTASGTGFTHAVIVGKPVGAGDFVRRAGENQTYSIEPAIDVEAQPRYWIDSRLLDVPVALLQSLEVKPAGGPGYSLHRLNPADNTFSLDGVPAGRKALDGHALAPGPTTVTGVTAEDVAPASTVDFGQASHLVITLTDGNIITIDGTVLADKHWIELTSSKDAALTAKARGRAFEIASYRYDALFKPLEQLLVPKEAPPPAKASPAAPAAQPPAPRKPRPPKAPPSATAP